MVRNVRRQKGISMEQSVTIEIQYIYMYIGEMTCVIGIDKFVKFSFVYIFASMDACCYNEFHYQHSTIQWMVWRP